MRRLPHLLVTLLALGFAQGQLAARYPPLPAHSLEDELLEESNRARLTRGLEPLKGDPHLALAARHHAAEMAELGYFSHESPHAETAGLLERLIYAGNPAQYVAENLALLPDTSRSAQQTTEGWLQSPGHRDNLLDPQHSHVGFGVAQRDRQIIVVQVLAYQPLQIEEVVLSSDSRLIRSLNIELELDVASHLVLAVNTDDQERFRLSPGTHSLTLSAPQRDSLHLHLGLATSAEQRSFIVEDEGWYSVADEQWQASPSAPRQRARITRLQHHDSDQPWVTLELSSSDPLPAGIAVWLADEPYAHERTGSHKLELSIAQSDLPGTLSFAIPDAAGPPNSYLVVARLRLVQEEGQWRVRPGS